MMSRTPWSATRHPRSRTLPSSLNDGTRSPARCSCAPHDEGEDICVELIDLALGGSDAVTRLLVDAQQHGRIRTRGKQTSREFCRLPWSNARVVQPCGDQHCRILRAVLDVKIA